MKCVNKNYALLFIIPIRTFKTATVPLLSSNYQTARCNTYPKLWAIDTQRTI